MPVRCPHCDVPLTQDEAAAELCPACGKSLKDGAGGHVREGRPAAPSRGEFVGQVANLPGKRQVGNLPHEFEELRTRPPVRDFDDDDFDDHSIRRSSFGSRLDPAWRTTQAGLNTMFHSYVAMIGTIVLCVVIFVLVLVFAAGGGFGRNVGPAGAAVILPLCLLAIGVLGGAIAHLVGLFMCLTAPTGKGWVGGCLGFLGLYIMVVVARSFFTMANPLPLGPNPNSLTILKVFSVVEGGIGFMAMLFFAMFIKRIAQYFANSFLNVITNVYLVFYAALVAFEFGVLLVSDGANRFFQFDPNRGIELDRLGAVVISGLLLMLLAVLVLSVLYAIVLRSARNTIAGAMSEY